MRGRAQRWRDQIRWLGEALFDLLEAEVAALRGDLGQTGRRLGQGVLILGAGAGFLFWTLGLFSLTGVETLDLWLPRWAAALVVSVVFLIVTLALAAWGLSVLRSLEAPGETVQRHWRDHRRWWSSEIAGVDSDFGEPPAPDERAEIPE